MSNERRLKELERQLESAEREMNAWQTSKHGASNAPMAARLVEALRAEIAALRSADKPSDT